MTAHVSNISASHNDLSELNFKPGRRNVLGRKFYVISLGGCFYKHAPNFYKINDECQNKP